MTRINWDEFKVYKRGLYKNDNFNILLDFIRSYYNITHPVDIYEMLEEDDTAKLMLKKRNIVEAEGLESYLFRIPHE